MKEKKNFYQITSPKDGKVLYEFNGPKTSEIIRSGDGKRILYERKNEE